MNNNSSGTNKPLHSISISPSAATSLIGKRMFASIAFGAAILLFFLPFCKLDLFVVAGAVSGFNLITGSSPALPANIWAILAFASAITGIVMFIRKEKKEALVGTLAGGIGFVALLLLHTSVSKSMGMQGSDGLGALRFTFAYWMTLLAFLAAGVSSFLQLQQKTTIAAEPPVTQSTPIHVSIITQTNDLAKDEQTLDELDKQ